MTAALALDCMDAIGGIKSAYILAGEITSYTEATGEITALVGTGDFFEIDLPKDTAFYSETITIAPANGTVFYQGVLTIILQKLTAAKRNQILLLAQNRELRIVFIDNNNTTYIMGLTRGSVMSGGTIQTGTALGDLSGYNLTFQSQEPQSIFPLDDTLVNVVSGINVVNASSAPTTTTAPTTTSPA